MSLGPKLSIITVVLNDSENFSKTVRSISQANYKNIEFIVIDGGSTDGTLEVIKSYKSWITEYCSEQDSGLYDAMNKGLDRATGEWLLFLNAGDVLVSNELIGQVLRSEIISEVNFLYGDSIIKYHNFERLQLAGNINDIQYGMQFSHQSVFIRQAYHREHKYNLNHKLCADFFLIYHAFCQGEKFLYVGIPVAMVASGGLSDKNREYVFWSFWRIVGFKDCGINLYYVFNIVSSCCKRVLKLFLTNLLSEKLLKKLWEIK